MLANVQQTTIRPIIEGVVAPGSCIHTDEYSIYARLTAWGYEHRTVCHGRGEYARDEDGDGFCEVHAEYSGRVLVIAALLAAPAPRQFPEKLPVYLGFFQFVHNTRQRGKALLGALVAALGA